MTTNITTIDFHGASLLVKQGPTPETTFVVMKPVVEGMGLSWAPQHKKLGEHPVLTKGITELMIPSVGGTQLMTAIPLTRLNFWLATIQPRKVKKADVRAKVITYQEEAADALFAHFFAKAAKSEQGLTKYDVQIIGNVVKNCAGVVIREALGEILPTAVAGYLAEHSLTISEGLTAGEVCDLSGISTKYPRGLSGRVSRRMTQFCARHNEKPRVSRLGRVRAQHFPTHLVREWLDVEGRTLIRRWMEEREGQKVLRLVQPHQPQAQV